MKLRNKRLSRFALLIANAAAVLLTALASQPAYSQAKQTRVTFDGDFANFTFVDGVTGAFSFLQVSRSVTGNTTQTFLFFHTESVNTAANTITYVDGSGFIPNQDFVGGSGQTLKRYSLNTNTTGNANFSADSATFDLTTLDLISGGPVSGLITGDFQQTKDFFHRFHGSNETEFTRPDGTSVRMHSVGTQLNGSAKAQASIFGLAFNNVTGGVGLNQSNGTTIEKTAH